MNINDVLIKPIITEKSTFLREGGCYSFIVHKDANKITIKNAVEKIFSVKVRDCKIINKKPKLKALRTKRGVGKTASAKKAMVYLIKDQTIADLDG